MWIQKSKVTVKIYGFDGARKGTYFREEPLRRTEVEVRVKRSRMIRHHVMLRLKEK